jgi:hypothetical protein
MNEDLIEVDSEKFNSFLVEIAPEHNFSESFSQYILHRKLHRLDSFQKNYINEILENYYGVHFLVQKNENYILSVTNRKLCTFFKIKYDL